MRPSAIALLILLSACRTTPSAMLSLMDAQSEGDIEDAINTAAAVLDRGPIESRMAAAKTLGRLKRPAPRALKSLGRVLHGPGQPPDLRAYCAWALGEMRDSASLKVLSQSLRKPIDQRTGYYVLEALAKHYAVISREQDSLVELAEALVFYAGNQKSEIPPMYDVLNARTRTVEVNIQVLDRAMGQVQSNRDPKALAALYNAAFELLSNLDLNREEIKASAAKWKGRVGEAVKQSGKTRTLLDPNTNRLILWYLGRLGELQEIGYPAAEALVGAKGDQKGRPTLSQDKGERFLAAWALAKMLLHGTGPRRALLKDVLLKEQDPAILKMLGESSPRPEDFDQLQKTIGVGDE